MDALVVHDDDANSRMMASGSASMAAGAAREGVRSYVSGSCSMSECPRPDHAPGLSEWVWVDVGRDTPTVSALRLQPEFRTCSAAERAAPASDGLNKMFKMQYLLYTFPLSKKLIINH